MQKLYVARRDKDGHAVVHVIEPDGDSHWLSPRRDIFSDHCFDWGCNHLGANHLAMVLLADALEDDYTALRFHQQFMAMCVARMPHAAWSMTANTVCRFAVVIAIGETANEHHRH